MALAKPPHITAADLENRAAAVIAAGGLAHRGVWDSITEARRQLGFGEDRFAVRWIARAEMLTGLITQDEFNATCDALQAAAHAGEDGPPKP